MPEDIRQEFRKSLYGLLAKILICFKCVSDGKQSQSSFCSKVTSKPHTRTFFLTVFLINRGKRNTEREYCVSKKLKS